MKYAINTKRPGYKIINYEDKINFENDILYFKHIKDAYRFLYYAKNNNFEIEVTKNLRENIHLIKVIIAHGGHVKLIQTKKTLKKSISQLQLNIMINYMKHRLKKVDFNPSLKFAEVNNKKIYILDGYIINDVNWDFEGKLVRGIIHKEELPFNTTISAELTKIDEVDEISLFGAYPEVYEYSIYKSKIKKNVFTPKVFIYSAKKVENGIEISVFYQGYEYFEKEFIINCIGDYEISYNDDWKYYSKNSELFKESFKRITIKQDKIELGFKYEDREAKILLSRHLQSSVIFNDLYVENNHKMIVFDSNVEKYKTDEYKKYEELQRNIEHEIYLFNDRQENADDNAEALYRYYMNNSNKNIWFALSKESPCWNRLFQHGFNLVDFGSEKHKELYLKATKVISSHAARRIYDPFYPSREFVNLEKRKFIFLQHGIIMGKHHGFLDKVNNPLDLIVASTKEESKIIKEFSGYENVVTTGLARYDNYTNSKDNVEKFIIYAPSWNVLYKDDLSNSQYIKEIEKVLNSKKINDVLSKTNVNLKLIMHPEFIKEEIQFKNNYNYKIFKKGEFLYSEVLSNTLGLITDYSSLLFDVLYQGKFVIEHQPYELHHENNILTEYQKGLYLTNNIINLEDAIEKLSMNKFKLGEEKIKVIKSFFDFDDLNNCKRNYMEIEALKDVIKY